MNGTQFVRRARRYAKRAGQDFRFVPARGKGSHGRLYVDRHFTTVKRGEIGPGLLNAMLRTLGIDKKDF